MSEENFIYAEFVFLLLQKLIKLGFLRPFGPLDHSGDFVLHGLRARKCRNLSHVSFMFIFHHRIDIYV